MALSEQLDFVLSAAESYSNTPSPAMSAREEGLRSIKSTLTSWLPSNIDIGVETASLSVEQGGWKGGISPVPWVRIFSPDYSPSATEGFYVTYLFAADGSRVYLSLMCGTSEYRANKMRPIRDPSRIKAVVQDKRRIFDGWSPEALAGLTTEIDLAVSELDVGAESKQRVANYEFASIYAVPYLAGQAATDQLLRDDLNRMLEMLTRIYLDESLPVDVSAAGTTPLPDSKNGGQSFVADSRVRKAIEDYSMAAVMSLYSKSGEWKVKDVSRYRPYDIELIHKETAEEVHVEVKGASKTASTVFLTKNEVKEAREFSHNILVVVHNIVLSVDGDSIFCSGGESLILDPWTPEERALVPVQYTYELPVGSGP